MNVSLPPPETIHVHFPHFLLSAFRCMEGCCLRLQDLCFSSPRPMLFARKTYGFGLQERFPTGARAMVLGTESGFRRGQEPGGQRPSLLPASTRINQNFWAK